MGIVYSTEVTVQVPDPIVVRYSLAAKKQERNQMWDFCNYAQFWHQLSCLVLVFRNSTFFRFINLSIFFNFYERIRTSDVFDNIQRNMGINFLRKSGLESIFFSYIQMHFPRIY